MSYRLLSSSQMSVSSRVASVSVSLPKVEPEKVYVEVPCECGPQSCPPRLSVGCNGCWAGGSFRYNTMCVYPGITGLIPGMEPSCIQFDEEWKTSAKCIGCDNAFEEPGYCPFTSSS